MTNIDDGETSPDLRTPDDPAADDPPEAVDWDAQAPGFDDEPDHGLREPAVREAWAARLRDWLPPPARDVLDLGCGTGSLSLLAAEQGHRVTGIDSSPAMVALARAKLAGRPAVFLVGDAAVPPVGEERFDVVLVRHVLWTLPDPGRVLRHWCGLLRPGGRLVLVEGVWGALSPVGISAERLRGMVAPLVADAEVVRLEGDALLWGRTVQDERYAVVARL
ncbi:class I SAM-dependent methyltransferase [Streptomyces stelliscabiei]|uniref:class I SAM-dependent methyltransferase n=1 Tax=Streptomyces stelliscabiei TaxID=146820 RepID=UPI0029ACF0E1|nr:class I SAM-dependent methyltransferase [Streptomyces stelliscabiei]MDX2555150.1 class I SAM-dependent methyltransferase [Streptomyces stelliscabiei]MDX2615503.1 class I SAM-dependent methyltransferase [Streptomyces stelliscabiei]MDX2639489.1 class I SAM-dependent methyltransferase [Streptomyces stelliscabiei]MDX2663983.1 class I SAM-dependent methyltransferase [Streptomyces stelliscabiei]MDX2712911.1 class I SAM-dependent methyltransferase [Streptomyces stelliscabiei]